MRFLHNDITPGPVIWAYAVATPALALNGDRVWWAHWVMTALAWYLVTTWGWTRWRQRQQRRLQQA